VRFGTDGLRGRYPSDMSEDVARRAGAAAAAVFPGSRILVGRDTRESGPSLVRAFVEGATAAGARCTDLGVAPTPAVAWLCRSQKCAGAVVTASHNPWKDNGVKLFAPGGTKLTDAQQDAVQALLDGAASASGAAGEPDDGSSMRESWVAHLVDTVGPGSLDGLRVVVDCGHGALSDLAPGVVAALGATVVAVNDAPDGRNINDGCGAAHPSRLGGLVRMHRADLGIAFDGDGDRVIAADHEGTIVDGDRVIALAAADLLRQGALEPRSVVVTVMTNAGFHAAMAALGIGVVTVPVGDRNVLAAMDRTGAVLGGEQSGHVVFGRHATTGDGLLTGALLAAIVRRSGTTLRELAMSAMEALPQVLLNAKAPAPRVAEEMADDIAAAEARLGGTGRVLVRASGTEPVVRVMVEAATEELAGDVARDLVAAVERRYPADR
jgi:phosphoglucosamine mutase